jgi:hypothetical protein
MATGDPWFFAWTFQSATPFARLARESGISAERINALDRGSQVTRGEIEGLAKAWRVEPADILTSLPAGTLAE